MHFVLSQSITFFHSYSITISHEKFLLFIDLSKPLFQSEAVSRMSYVKLMGWGANRGFLKYRQGQLSHCLLWLLFQFKNRSFLSCQQSGEMTSTPNNAVEAGFLDSVPCGG